MRLIQARGTQTAVQPQSDDFDTALTHSKKLTAKLGSHVGNGQSTSCIKGTSARAEFPETASEAACNTRNHKSKDNKPSSDDFPLKFVSSDARRKLKTLSLNSSGLKLTLRVFQALFNKLINLKINKKKR